MLQLISEKKVARVTPSVFNQIKSALGVFYSKTALKRTRSVPIKIARSERWSLNRAHI